MGILDNDTVIVDAILTKLGRQKLANGEPLGISLDKQPRSKRAKHANIATLLTGLLNCLSGLLARY